MAEEDYEDLDLASGQAFELDPLTINGSNIGIDELYGFDELYGDDFADRDLFDQFTDPAFLEGGIYGGAGATSYEDMTDEERAAYDALFGGAYPDTIYGTSPSRGRYLGSSGIFPGRGGRVRLGPNTSVPMGPLLAGGAAVTLTGDDDEETTVPAILPGDDDMDDTTTTTTPTYTLDPMGRIIPASQAGTLPELASFFGAYGDMAPGFARQMADVTGKGQTAFAQQVLGMEGDAISAFDIAQEASRQQRGALGDVFGLGPDATYADITAAGTAPMQALTQVRETVLPGLESAFQTTQERLEKGLTGRERQQVEQATRARFGALGRGADTAALATEIGDIMQEERGLYSQNLQDLLGIGGTTGALIGQEAYAMSPFTKAAIGSADLGPGLALAGDIGRQAAAATPSPTDIFGLEAGERQFSLNQQALQQMAEAGRLDLIAQGIGTLASGFRGGPSAGLQQQNLGTPPYFPQQFQQGDQYRFPLGG